MVNFAQPLSVDRSNLLPVMGVNLLAGDQLVNTLSEYLLKYQALIDDPDHTDGSFISSGLYKLAFKVFTGHPNKADIATRAMGSIVGRITFIANAAGLLDHIDYMSSMSLRSKAIAFEPMWLIKDSLQLPELEKSDILDMVGRLNQLNKDYGVTLKGFGVSDCDGGLITLMNIILNGIVKVGTLKPILSGGFATGSGYTTNAHGYYFVVATDKKNHFAYIVPTEADRAYIIEALAIAESLGFINQQELTAIVARVVTAAQVLEFNDDAFGDNQAFVLHVALRNNL